jgi:hypothetical protein
MSTKEFISVMNVLAPLGLWRNTHRQMKPWLRYGTDGLGKRRGES